MAIVNGKIVTNYNFFGTGKTLADVKDMMDKRDSFKFIEAKVDEFVTSKDLKKLESRENSGPFICQLAFLLSKGQRIQLVQRINYRQVYDKVIDTVQRELFGED